MARIPTIKERSTYMMRELLKHEFPEGASFLVALKWHERKKAEMNELALEIGMEREGVSEFADEVFLEAFKEWHATYIEKVSG